MSLSGNVSYRETTGEEISITGILALIGWSGADPVESNGLPAYRGHGGSKRSDPVFGLSVSGDWRAILREVLSTSSGFKVFLYFFFLFFYGGGYLILNTWVPIPVALSSDFCSSIVPNVSLFLLFALLVERKVGLPVPRGRM